MSLVLFLIHIPSGMTSQEESDDVIQEGATTLPTIQVDEVTSEEKDKESTDEQVNQKSTNETEEVEENSTSPKIVETVDSALHVSFDVEPSIKTEDEKVETSQEDPTQSEEVVSPEPEENAQLPAKNEIENNTAQNEVESKKRKFERSNSLRFKDGVESILKLAKIEKVTWKLTSDAYWEVTFPCAANRADDLLRQFLDAGIGNNSYSSISIVPITVNFPDMLHTRLNSDDVEKRFIESVRSKLTVVQVIDAVKKNSQLTFDYIMLIGMASIIAAVGLFENSSVLLVASMLVSPLMGPIMGGTFGIVLRYRPLWTPGIINETIGLAMCLVSGFVYGLLSGLLIPKWSIVTSEMASRGDPWSLFVGLAIAIPSGAGVAISILGGNSGSLVGVAISASLLPPAVNAGICWAFALIGAASGNTQGVTKDFVGVNFRQVDPSELGKIGAISMTLTLINILIIFVMGVIFLKIKEVAPHTATTVTRTFWKEDLKSTRQHLRERKLDMRHLGDEILEDWGTVNNIDMEETMKGEKAVQIADQLKWALELLESNDDYNGVVSQLPGKSRARRLSPLVRACTVERGGRFNVSKVYQPSITTNRSRFLVKTLEEINETHPAKTESYINLMDSSPSAVIKRSNKLSVVKQPLLDKTSSSVRPDQIEIVGFAE